jgi:acetylglutamate kinase
MLADVVALDAQGERVVVVHCGGAAVSAWMTRLGLTPTFKDGLRVTDEPALEVVRMVLAGTINQQLVAVACRLGARAVGLTGLDGGLLQARRVAGDLGFVGEVTAVRSALLATLLADGFLPVVAPIGVEAADEDGDQPTVYNINADVVAGAVAAALGARAAVFMTDVPGVRGADGAVLPRLSARQVERMIDDGVIGGGMIPKVRACLDALAGAAITPAAGVRSPFWTGDLPQQGAAFTGTSPGHNSRRRTTKESAIHERARVAVILDGRQPHALRDWAAGHHGGTIIEKEDP